MKDFERVILLILDSVGVGELPDADEYGDVGANTLGNIASYCSGLSLPNLQNMGLGNIISLAGVPPLKYPNAYYGKMAEISAGKDTTTGHWEIAGLHLSEPFRTFPNGFPEAIVVPFSEMIGTGILANKPASGTAIIDEYGAEHLATGKPIIYTSADSVFQIAAHEQVIPLERLYEMCEIARGLLQGEYAVARVIARPFIGKPGAFQRTSSRKDYSVSPPQPTMLDKLSQAGKEVIGVGKIYDIFNGQGVTTSIKTKNNLEGLQALEQLLEEDSHGLLFVNLVDFDMLYGHRNDPKGYAAALREVDEYLPRILQSLKETDLLIITADHGCDPTTNGSDHTREYVPLLVHHKNITKGESLGTRETFSDISSTILEIFDVEPAGNGTSFLSTLQKRC